MKQNALLTPIEYFKQFKVNSLQPTSKSVDFDNLGDGSPIILYYRMGSMSTGT